MQRFESDLKDHSNVLMEARWLLWAVGILQFLHCAEGNARIDVASPICRRTSLNGSGPSLGGLVAAVSDGIALRGGLVDLAFFVEPMTCVPLLYVGCGSRPGLLITASGGVWTRARVVGVTLGVTPSPTTRETL